MEPNETDLYSRERKGLREKQIEVNTFLTDFNNVKTLNEKEKTHKIFF